MKFLALQQTIRQQANPSGAMHIGRDEPAEGFQIAQQRGALADLLKVIDFKRNSRFARDRRVECSTEFVDPPLAATDAIAFSMASRVRISFTLAPRFNKSSASSPQRKATSSLWGSIAGTLL